MGMWIIEDCKEGRLRGILFWLVAWNRSLTCRKLTLLSQRVGLDTGSSFEEAILSRTQNCKVHGFDFSASQARPGIHGLDAAANNNQYHALNSRASFHRIGLSGTNGYLPKDDTQLLTLESLMGFNGVLAFNPLV